MKTNVKVTSVALAVIVLLSSAGQWAAMACQQCSYGDRIDITGNPATWRFPPGELVYICDGVKQEYSAPGCYDTYDSVSCIWPEGSTVTVPVTTYVSPGCGAPGWQIDYEAPLTKQVPNCDTVGGC